MLRKLHDFIKLEGDTGGGTGGDDGTGGEGGKGGKGGGSDPGGEENWRTGITDEYLRGNPGLKDYTDITALAKSHIELQSMVGGSIRVPGPDASDEERSTFYASLVEKVPTLMPKPNLDDEVQRNAFLDSMGRPAKPEEYTVPEGINADDPSIKLYREAAHKQGLTQSQFESIVADVTNHNVQVRKTVDAKRDEGLALLHQEWGVKFDSNIGLAKAVAERTKAPPELIAAIENNKANPATLKWLYELGHVVGQEGINITSDDGGANPGMLNPAEAKKRINEMLANKQHPYWERNHPQHEEAVQRRMKLEEMARSGQ